MNPYHDYFGVPWYLILVCWTAVALGSHIYQVGYIVKLIKLGKTDDRFDSWQRRMKEFLTDWFGQRKVVEDKLAGYAHALIFWGFLLLISDILDLGTGGALSKFLKLIYLDGIWNLVVDIGYVMAFVGVSVALYRRLIIRPKKLREESIEGPLILVAIMGIVLTAFIIEAGEMYMGVKNQWEPIGVLFAGMIKGMDEQSVQSMIDVSYWIHMILIGAFLIEIPRTKHSHLIGTIPNVMFQDHDYMGKMHPLEVDKTGKAVSIDDMSIERFGVNDFTDFTWRQLSDGWACTACARCQDVCPAYESGKTLNPMQIVMDVKNYGTEHGKELLANLVPEEKIPDRFGRDAIWACTTCYACVEACPVHIEHVPKLMDARRHLVLEATEYPKELQVLFDNLENHSNPWGIGAHKRADWAKDLGVKVGEPAEVLYFVGCAGSFDGRNKEVARSTAKLMKEAGVDFAILGEMEGCNGDPARRAGNDYLFQSLAETNIETFKSVGIKKIVTSCPHCYHTIGKEYPDYGMDCEVVHHTQMLADLRKEGKIKTRERDFSLTFHDPCYLSRIDGEVDAPRDALGGEIIEMHRCKNKTFCCGAGGARMWMEEDSDKRVNTIRAKEALDTGAEQIVVSCPFCMTMISDGLKEMGEERPVKDVSEVILDHLE